MILNHKDAIEFLVRNVDDTGFNGVVTLTSAATLAYFDTFLRGDSGFIPDLKCLEAVVSNC